jgi:putative adhesin
MVCRTMKRVAGASVAALFTLALALPVHAEVKEEFHKTVPLNADGRVSLDNVNGGVEITGWNRNEVQIDAVKTASDQQKLNDIKIEVNGSGNSVEIETKFAKRMNNNPGGVQYTLHVPQNARIDKINLVNGSMTVQKLTGEINANLVNGKVQASDLTGTADMATVNGTIEANYSSLTSVREIKLKSVNGTIDLKLPPSPNAEVEASTVNGGISTDFPLQVKGQWVGKNMSGTLGSGGVHIELSNVNGSIHLGPGRGNL